MRDPATIVTRAELLAHAERLRRAAALIDRRASRVREETAPAHAETLRQARAMVRAVVSSEAPPDA